jgi:hypothetical protein
MTKEILTDGSPHFAFEVLNWAKKAGWIGAVDGGYSRTLIFCSDVCVEKAKTKSGSFRLRPPPRTKEANHVG